MPINVSNRNQAVRQTMDQLIAKGALRRPQSGDKLLLQAVHNATVEALEMLYMMGYRASRDEMIHTT